ncbi:hypothetical protein D3C80_1391190 [compost metagenome]
MLIAVVLRSVPIQKSSVKLSSAKTPGTRITVVSRSAISGMNALTTNMSAAKLNAGTPKRPRSVSRFIEPLLPIVTKRRASFSRYISRKIEMLPSTTMVAARTALMPAWLVESARKRDVARTSKPTGTPRI